MEPKKAVKSDDYVQKLASLPKLSDSQKKAALGNIIKDANHMKRLGVAMIGPIQIRLRYEGVVRNVLVEDTLDKGPLLPYDVLDDFGTAYFLNQVDSEVRVTPFEGKQVFPKLFRLAAFPRIRKEDLYYLRVNAIEFAQDESRQAIQKQEDTRMFALIETAITNYETFTGTAVTKYIGAGNPIEMVDFYDLVGILEGRQIEASRLLLHPQDARDIYSWDLNVTGWQFKDDIMGGKVVTGFGEFTIQKTIMQTVGTIHMVPEPNFLGVMPIMYSLDVEENNQVEQFYRGWVMDELIAFLILNPRGLSRVYKQ